MLKTIDLDDLERRQEAARYALFRRLAPGLRHGLMGQMQGLQFLGELGLRQSRRSRNPAHVMATLERIPQQTTVAIERCHALTRWFNPDREERAGVASIIHEVRELLEVELSLRGIEVSAHHIDCEAIVARAAASEVLAAALLASADALQVTAGLDFSATIGEGCVDVHIRSTEQSAATPPPPPAYRRMDFGDVDALAAAGALACAQVGGATRVRMATIASGRA